MSKKKRAIIVTVVVGLLLAIMLFVFMTQLEKEMLSDYETKEVVRSVKEIPAGTWIDESNVTEYFALEMINGKMVTSETICSFTELYDAYVTRDIGVGEMIYFRVLRTEKMLKEGFRSPVEISVRVEDVANAVAGTIRKGDCINIYANEADTTAKNKEYKEILSNVMITETYNSAGEIIGMSNETEKASIITFYVEEDRVAELQTKFASGTIIISKKITE